MKTISRQQAADIAGVSSQTVSNWISSGKLQAIQLNNRSVRVYEQSLFELFPLLIERDKLISELKIENSELELQIKKSRNLKAILKTHAIHERQVSEVISVLYSMINSDFIRKKIGERNVNIACDFLEGNSIQSISEQYQITLIRISQIIGRTIRMFRAALTRIEQVENKEIRIKVLERKLKEYEPEIIIEDVYSEEEKKTKLYETKLSTLNLTVRALNCLNAADIETLGELVKYEKYQLLKFRNFGKKSVNELDDLLESLNLKWCTKL